MHADSIPQTPESLVYRISALLYFSLQFKLRMEETVCGSYDSKSAPVAQRIYPVPFHGARSLQKRECHLNRVSSFFLRPLPLSFPLSIFHRRTGSAGVSFSHSMRFRFRCEENPLASHDGTGVLPGLPRKIQ